MSCKNHFVETLQSVLPELNDRKGIFKKWIGLAKDKVKWEELIKKFFGEDNSEEEDKTENNAISNDGNSTAMRIRNHHSIPGN